MSLARFAVPLPGGLDPMWPQLNEVPAPDSPDFFNGVRLQKYCLFATTYWIYQATFGAPPSRHIMLGVVSPQVFTNACLRHAQEVQQSIETQAAGIKFRSGGGAVPAGSLLIFTTRDNRAHAEHACVLKQANLIAGYNQTQWFTTAGQPMGFSEHTTPSIPWHPDKHSTVRNGKQYKLFAVSQRAALAEMHSALSAPRPRRGN